MTKTIHLKPRRLAIVFVVALLVAIGTYAFTASNVVPGTQAGAGSGNITGYTVSSVAYGLNATTPSNIDTVTFTIAPTSAGTVKIQLVTAGTWYDCTNTAGAVSCDTTVGTQATVSPSNSLTVVATS
jgi:hypothetical protein